MIGTTTGRVLEDMVIPPLERGGYAIARQVNIGFRPGGSPHIVDATVTKDGDTHLVSLKWQQVTGTAEQKVPFEVICLSEAVRDGYTSAYLVLGGEGWLLRDFYTRGGLSAHLVDANSVRVVTLERFVALASRGAL